MRIISYAPVAFNVLMEEMVVQILKVGHLVEIRSSSSLLKVNSDGGHATTTKTAAASTATMSTVTTSSNITKTNTSVANTTSAEDIEKNILGKVEGKFSLNQNILCAYRLLMREYQQ